jgi:hypothetical protein
LGEAEREQIRLAEEVPRLWHAPTTMPADRRQIVRLLIDRVVLSVAQWNDRVGVRVEWAGGAMRERMIERPVQGYKSLQSWQRLSDRLAELHGRGETPKTIAATLTEEGFRPPKRASRLIAGIVRRLLDQLGLRPRVPRGVASGESPSSGEKWLQNLARELGVSPHTLHGWRKKGWMNARQVGGRGGPWAVWTDGAEMDRLWAFKECPRL